MGTSRLKVFNSSLQRAGAYKMVYNSGAFHRNARTVVNRTDSETGPISSAATTVSSFPFCDIQILDPLALARFVDATVYDESSQPSLYNRTRRDCASCHENRCGISSSSPQMKAEREAILELAMSENGEELHLKTDEKVTPPCPNCCSAIQHQSLGILMEDNIRMRQTINNMLLTLTHWIRQNKEQTEQVRLLMQMLKETDQQKEKERNRLQQNLEAMAVQMKASEADLATERQNRLLANREKEVAKQLILKLQEENWGLRKARSTALMSRDVSYHSANGFPSRLSPS